MRVLLSHGSHPCDETRNIPWYSRARAARLPTHTCTDHVHSEHTHSEHMHTEHMHSETMHSESHRITRRTQAHRHKVGGTTRFYWTRHVRYRDHRG